MSGRPKKMPRKSCCTFHVVRRSGAARPGALPIGGTLTATCVCDYNPHTCVRMHTLLDDRPGLPLAWAGLSYVPPLDILGPTGTGFGKQTAPLCEGKGAPSSTWTRARARAQSWQANHELHPSPHLPLGRLVTRTSYTTVLAPAAR